MRKFWQHFSARFCVAISNFGRFSLFGASGSFRRSSSRRSDISLCNLYGGGRQVIIDVAVTGVDSFDRKVDDHPNQPMTKRAKQKIAKCKKSAEQHDFLFTPFVVSHNGQILPETAAFICKQKKLMEGSNNPRIMLYVSHRRVIPLWLSTKRLAETSKITKMIDVSNEEGRHVSASIQCEHPFS